MEGTILKAKLLIAEHFKISPIHFDQHTSRKRIYVEARRFLVYFLRNELNFTFYEIVDAIPSYTNHATALHHYRRMCEIMQIEKPIQNFYKKLVTKVLDNNNNLVEREMIILQTEKQELTKKLNKLKKLL